eukprot:scaffold2610_cov115-Isochrysis_galbana.AAC.11
MVPPAQAVPRQHPAPLLCAAVGARWAADRAAPAAAAALAAARPECRHASRSGALSADADTASRSRSRPRCAARSALRSCCRRRTCSTSSHDGSNSPAASCACHDTTASANCSLRIASRSRDGSPSPWGRRAASRSCSSRGRLQKEDTPSTKGTRRRVVLASGEKRDSSKSLSSYRVSRRRLPLAPLPPRAAIPPPASCVTSRCAGPFACCFPATVPTAPGGPAAVLAPALELRAAAQPAAPSSGAPRNRPPAPSATSLFVALPNRRALLPCG